MDRARLPHPPLLKQFPFTVAVRMLASTDIRPTQAQHDRFREFAQVGDPLADAAAAKLRELPDGRVLFERAVTEGIYAVSDPPEELVALFSQAEALPYWLDRDKLDLAARAITRTGLWGLVFPLNDVALMGGYLASRADKTLMATGNLDKMVARRITETASWWVDVTSPGGLERFGPGFTGVLRVRMVHAQVRAAMNRRPDWDYEAWDHPVNQVQTAGTLLLFSHVFLLGSKVLGLRFTARERDAIIHLWRYVGWLLGVDAELLPTSEADAWRLFWLEAATEFLPDEDSLLLAQALLKAQPDVLVPGSGPLSKLAGRAVIAYKGSFSRLVLGKSNAEFLRLPDSTVFQAAVLATGAVNYVMETVRMCVPGATRLRLRIGDGARQRMIERNTRRHNPDRTYARHLYPKSA